MHTTPYPLMSLAIFSAEIINVVTRILRTIRHCLRWVSNHLRSPTHLRYEIATMWLEITVEAEWDSVLSPFNYEPSIAQTCVGNAKDVTLVDCGVKKGAANCYSFRD